MQHRPPLPILLLAAMATAILYAPQPLLPTFTSIYGVSHTEASALITISMITLGLAPLVYGYVLEGLSAYKMLIAATVLMAICQILISVTDNWHIFLLLRATQSLGIPALLTSAMTIMTSASRHEHVRDAAAWYVAATIVGGLGGRVITSLLTQATSWQVSMGFWGVLLLILVLTAMRLQHSEKSAFRKVKPHVFREVLSIPGIWHVYIAIFCQFFAFSAMLNVIPFRLTQLHPNINVGTIGLIYLGYIAGLISSLNTTRMHALTGSETRTFVIGLLVFMGSILMLLTTHIAMSFIAMFAFCGAMFLIHTGLSGHANHLSEKHKGIVNGCYIASYYLGGGMGTWLATWIYSHYGWQVFTGTLIGVCLITMWQIALLRLKDNI